MSRTNVRNREPKKAISCPGFDARIWNVFAGKCKAKGQTIKETLEKVLRDWIREQEGMGI